MNFLLFYLWAAVEIPNMRVLNLAIILKGRFGKKIFLFFVGD